MRRVMALWGVKWPRRRYARLDAYLFATTLVNRLQAVTDLENQAEQRVLERLGFRREGVLRGLPPGTWLTSVFGWGISPRPSGRRAPPRPADCSTTT